MTELANKLGLIRKDGILMTKEEAAGGFDRDIARQNLEKQRGRAAFLSSFESLKAEANGLGVSERPGQSLRLSVHRARADLPEGVQAALQRSDAKEARRNGGSTSARASGFATAAKASTSQPHDRVKFVAAALERDPALKGKHGDALAMLADPDFAGLTGAAVVKSLKAGITVSRPASVASKASASSKAAHPARAAAPAPKAASTALWDKAIASMGRSAPPLKAPSKASAKAWDNVIGRMKAPAY